MSYDAPVYKSADFSYHKQNRIMIVEASTIGYNLVVPQIRIESRTGTVILFERHKTDYDYSGEDVAGWRYRPVKGAVMERPHLEGLEVLIIND